MLTPPTNCFMCIMFLLVMKTLSGAPVEMYISNCSCLIVYKISAPNFMLLVIFLNSQLDALFSRSIFPRIYF